MRNKVKQLMNKEEGFTLVELLAVIVILGIILAIAIPSVGGIVDRAQGNANEAEQELVIDAARLYFTAGKDSAGTELTADGALATETEVTVSELVAAGFLEDRGEDGIVNGKVTRTQSETTNTYSYEFVPAS